MDSKLSGKHIVITGGTGALGSTVVELLLEAGSKCSIPCHTPSKLEKLSFKDHDNLFFKTGVDLTEEQAAEKFYSDAVDSGGPLWASIHIAGGFGMGKIENSSKADFMKQINMNLVTCYNACRHAVAEIRKEGSGGRIVNIASRPALEPRTGAGMISYTTAKAGVAALTQSLAEELAEENILVNAVAPSIIDTSANRKAMSDANYENWPKPGEIARHILFLVSPENRVTRGGIIPVYGKS